MKKVIINIVLILTFIIIYVLQSNFFTWFTIAGIMPNLFVVFILFIGLFSNKYMGIIYGIIFGFIIDLLLNQPIGLSAIGLGIVGYLAGVFDKNFSKDTKMIMIVMVISSTLIYEIVMYLLNYIINDISIEIISFLRIASIEVLFNILLTIIIYPLIQKAGYYIENIYKGNQILTRYF